MIAKNEGKSEDNQSFYHKENGLPAKLKKKKIRTFLCLLCRRFLQQWERKIYFHQDAHKLYFLLWPNRGVYVLCLTTQPCRARVAHFLLQKPQCRCFPAPLFLGSLTLRPGLWIPRRGSVLTQGLAWGHHKEMKYRHGWLLRAHQSH